jgi:hypothetical protein
MTDLYQEYSAVNNTARPCYSNLKCYGCAGMYKAIVPPTPVTVQPWMFNMMTPHRMPNSELRHTRNAPRCGPYVNLDGTCRKCFS